MSFLDCNGALIPYSFEQWKDDNRSAEGGSRRDRKFSHNFFSPFFILSHDTFSVQCAEYAKRKKTEFYDGINHSSTLGTPTRQGNSRMSPTLSGSDSYSDRQFIAITSEKSARVIALPSQNCVYRQIITETDYVVKAEIISLKGKNAQTKTERKTNYRVEVKEIFNNR